MEFFQLGNFHFANPLHSFFLVILPVSSCVCNKKIFIKNINAIDNKKWVKFVAMQQDSATLN